MLKQIKYSARQGIVLRLFAVGFFIVMNIVFGILGTLDLYGYAGKIVAVTLSSVSLAGLFVVSIIVDSMAIQSMFTAPLAYHSSLIPVSGKKVLLGKIIPIVVFDLISLSIGIIGVVWQSFILSNIVGIVKSYSDYQYIVWVALLCIFYYTFIICAIFFGCAVEKSLFYKSKIKKLLGVVVFLVSLYVLSLLDSILILLLPVTKLGFFTLVSINPEFSIHSIIYFAIFLVKIAILFFATSYLFERKINL